MKMPKIKSWGILALVISPIIVTFSGWKLAKAQLTPELLISVEFPKAKRPESAETYSGGTRSLDCLTEKANQEKKKLRVLMPMPLEKKELPESTYYLISGTTISTNPKFFVYLPEHTAESAEFVIKENSGESDTKTEFKISGSSGIVKLTLPEKVNLEANKEYTWSFSIVCNPDERSLDLFVQGTIKKVEISSDLENKLENATTPLEKAKIYAEAGIWYDMIATVADLHASDHAKWKEEWTELLRSVELKDYIVSAPFASCCELKQ
jgi:hypothetical protein